MISLQWFGLKPNVFDRYPLANANGNEAKKSINQVQ
jgi:hypothetical protein